MRWMNGILFFLALFSHIYRYLYRGWFLNYLFENSIFFFALFSALAHQNALCIVHSSEFSVGIVGRCFSIWYFADCWPYTIFGVRMLQTLTLRVLFKCGLFITSSLCIQVKFSALICHFSYSFWSYQREITASRYMSMQVKSSSDVFAHLFKASSLLFPFKKRI